jgi:acetate kinase
MPDSINPAALPEKCLVVINAGSSSIKFSLFAGATCAALTGFVHGGIELIGSTPHFFADSINGQRLAGHRWQCATSHDDLLGYLIAWIKDTVGPDRLMAAGHRVAHGGFSCNGPQRITADVLAQLQVATPLAPLHQPHNLAPIAALAAWHPDLPQVACFDTGFHAGNPRISRLYGLPAALTDEGIRRFGFHGLSYEYIAGELPRVDPRAAAGRTIVAHLGNGASLCALVNGTSVATTMGFSALDGLLMGTRCGALDPGVVLYLLQEKKMCAGAIEALLYQQSGLLGVSGISNDMRCLLSSNDPAAREAIDLFVYRAIREIGSLAAAAGGLDALVFTAGIGQHAPEIRARICAQSAWLGIRLDPVSNRAGGPCISMPDSPVTVWVIPTNEELMVARHTFSLTGARDQQ